MGKKQKSFFNKKNKGFTLVEVLVVIAIIGLLASFVFIAASEAKDKARVAGGLNFGSQVLHFLGSEAVGIWTFDDGTAKDSSGNNKDGILLGSPESVEGVVGEALEFGWNDLVKVDDEGENDILDIDNGITVESWIKKISGLDESRFILQKVDAYKLSYVVEGGIKKISFDLDPGDPLEFEVNFKEGKWYHIAATAFVGPFSKMKIFIDGKEVAVKDPSIWPPFIWTNDNAVYIGDPAGGDILDEVRLYNVAFISAQIRQHYVEGAKKRGLLVEK